MATSPSTGTPLPKQTKPSYHHGDLRRALLDATVQLIEEQGLEAVSVREVARRTGVSPGAPFRHFQNRTALLTAVAEVAQERLQQAVGEWLRNAEEADPLQKYRAIGMGFLHWAFANPTHFQVISTRAAIEFDRPTLRERNDGLRGKMNQLLTEAAARGLLRPGDVGRHVLGGRALVYGLARMHIDGQFPSWGVDSADALNESIAVLDQFIASISAS
jgi:AcrR family transcriptional regulator